VFPLTEGGETIGALALYSNELTSYSSDHLHLLESVSRLASTALQHAMLHEQTKASAQTDALTGLPNGRALYARLDQELAQPTDQCSSLTVLCFNLSGCERLTSSLVIRRGSDACRSCRTTAPRSRQAGC
jgi:GAF domain-containing protein